MESGGQENPKKKQNKKHKKEKPPEESNMEDGREGRREAELLKKGPWENSE